MPDNVNHPAHYESGQFECIDVMLETQGAEIVKPPERIRFDSGKTMPKWYADLWHLPKDERSRLRSQTFKGIAEAMAEQWG